MSLTRTHIAFLGIISIFTGIIWPGTHSGAILLSYLMTNMRPIIYIILISLILAFAFAAFRRWRFYRFIVSIIILSLVVLASLTAFWYVSASRDSVAASGYSWGWIFLIVWSVLLFWSYKQRGDETSDGKFSETIDTIIGIMGGFALACIAWVIILSSLSFFTKGRDSSEILIRHYGSWEVWVLSWEVKIYGSFESLPTIKYSRWEDYLILIYSENKGKYWEYRWNTAILSGVLRNDESPYMINNEVYTIDTDGHVRTSSGRVMLWSRSTENRDAIFYKEDGKLEYLTENGRTALSYTGIISSPILMSEDTKTLVWIENKNNLKYVIKNGVRLWSWSQSISHIALSPNWQNITYLSEGEGEKIIVRNDIAIGKLPNITLSGTYTSNGAHSIYATKEKENIEVHLDSSRISRWLSEVREVFLEKNGGGSYAYFWKPVGDDKWCLFTRYKGNLCGLEWYMNPRIWADGSSILFAGRKDGVWNIYRNTDSIARDMWYQPSSIVYDYAFYDLTNPRTYLFISFDPVTQKYSYRKNGKSIPWTWDDVSTEVAFGYDNHILTSAKKDGKWMIIEL